MKRLILAAALCVAALPAFATSVGVVDRSGAPAGVADMVAPVCQTGGAYASCGGGTSVTLAPPVHASAYSPGTSMGGLLIIPNAVRAPGGCGFIQNARLTSAGGMNGSFDILFFGANPSSSTVSDTATLSIAGADLSAYIQPIHLTDVTSLGTPTGTGAGQQALHFCIPGGTTLYAVLVARSSVTPSSTSDISLTLDIVQ